MMHAATVQWNCATPVLRDYKPPGANNDPAVGEGVTYLYVGDKHLRVSYGADAEFDLPLDGKRGWSDSGIHLVPYDNRDVFVQIEISRWRRFDYRPHLALAWAARGATTVEYRDTGMMLGGGAHRLGIFVRDQRVDLRVDGRSICSTPAAAFVLPSERKYFQIRTETSMPGRNSGARVSHLRLKRDTDVTPHPYVTDCVLHRHGVFWRQAGNGRFAAAGAFYPSEATFFTGVDPATSCRTSTSNRS